MTFFIYENHERRKDEIDKIIWMCKDTKIYKTGIFVDSKLAADF